MFCQPLSLSLAALGDYAFTMSEGIEIHYDDKRQYLELACEPDAFAAYRGVARQHLSDFPEIDIDRVIEIHIMDTATFVRRRNAPRRRIWDAVFIVLLVLVLTLAAIGAISLAARVWHHPSPNHALQRTEASVRVFSVYHASSRQPLSLSLAALGPATTPSWRTPSR
ncbi:MAG: hypothetical protein INR62_05180 [Rhodospirillales bacterium]|nr:hypothetical protein [Acetobacter sp.]